MKLAIYFFPMLMLPAQSIAQRHPDSAISIGDTLLINDSFRAVNNRKSFIKLSDYRGKIMLLDFWASWCSSCIKNFDKLDSLQRKYNQHLQVVLVNTKSTGDTKDKISNLLSKLTNKAGQFLQLPSIFEDIILDKAFPHKLLPHYVWINPTGRVVGITGADAITTENIESLISGKIPDFIAKKDNGTFDRKSPLFINGNGGDEKYIYRSLLTGYAKNLPSSSYIKTDSKGLISRISFTNLPILLLIRQAYQVGLPVRRMVTQSSPLDLNYTNHDDRWVANNSYCYELEIPPSDKETAFGYMQNDLKRYFGLKGEVKEIETDCYVLTVDSSRVEKIRTKNGTPVNHLFEFVDRKMVNKPMSVLRDFLDSRLDLPVIDESNISFNIDLVLPIGDTHNILLIEPALKMQGIFITRTMRNAKQFYITGSGKQ